MYTVLIRIVFITNIPLKGKEKNVIRIGRNDARMVNWMGNIRLEEYHERMLTDPNIVVVWSSSKTGRQCMV